MPTSTREILLARYHYDPLDRLVDCAPFDQAAIQRYYCKKRLYTELQGATQRTIVQNDDQLLAQQQREGDKTTASLLATDQQRSVLNALDADRPHSLAYTPYGHRPPENGLLSLLGFTGERPDPVTGHYHLGNGYRQFSPGLMRFTSPDSWSPFGEGGLNGYGYCAGDPINRADPNGHTWTNFLIYFSRPVKALKLPRASLHNATAKASKPAMTIASQTGTPPSPSNFHSSASAIAPQEPVLSKPLTSSQVSTTPNDLPRHLDSSNPNISAAQLSRTQPIQSPASSKANTVQRSAQPKPTLPEYSDPAKAADLKYRLSKIERRYRRMSEQDDYYYHATPLKNALEALEIRTK